MKNLIIITFVSVLLFACKEKEPLPKPAPAPTAIVVLPKVKYVKDIELGNQYIQAGAPRFYTVSDSSTSADKSKKFDFAFIYYSETNRYAIGCANDNDIRTAHATLSENTVDFYTITDANSVTFDTVKLATSPEKIITTKGKRVQTELKSTWFASDQYGWAENNTIFGYRLANGKYGLGKITIAPTGKKPVPGSLKLEDTGAGSVGFELKYPR